MVEKQTATMRWKDMIYFWGYSVLDLSEFHWLAIMYRVFLTPLWRQITLRQMYCVSRARIIFAWSMCYITKYLQVSSSVLLFFLIEIISQCILIFEKCLNVTGMSMPHTYISKQNRANIITFIQYPVWLLLNNPFFPGCFSHYFYYVSTFLLSQRHSNRFRQGLEKQPMHKRRWVHFKEE